eukprot:2566663-Rhodomonas_salina.2
METDIRRWRPAAQRRLPSNLLRLGAPTLCGTPHHARRMDCGVSVFGGSGRNHKTGGVEEGSGGGWRRGERGRLGGTRSRGS